MIKIILDYIITFFKELFSLFFNKNAELSSKDIRYRYQGIKSLIQTFTIIVLLLAILLLGGYYVKVRTIIKEPNVEIIRDVNISIR